MAKRPSWFLNAAKRTLHTALPGLARPDDEYAAALLEEPERELFARLSAAEREHAIGVARCVERRAPGVARTVLRAALLHDIGKLGFSNNVVWRVLTHLLPSAEVAPEPRLEGLAGARQADRHHAAYGRELILAAGGHAEVARLVEAHEDVGGDPAARLIAECDERT